MPFDLTRWKEEAAKQLKGWKKRFDHAGTNSAYYFIAASSLLPVAQAAHGGDWSALATLGTVLGGAVSTNLLANMVQKLKDKNDEEVAQELAVEAQADPALKDEIDALFEKLETLPEAERALAGKAKAWFVETIQNELKQVGSRLSYNATVNGNGAIAQGDGAIALGKDSTYVAGNYIEHRYEAPNLRQIEQGQEADARTTYVQNFYRHCQMLPLIALGDNPNAREDVTLNDVYISLNITTTFEYSEESIEREKKLGVQGLIRRPEKDVPITAMEAATQNDRLVLLGDPGSGKSTFVRNLLAMQAQVLLDKRDAIDGIPDTLVPVLVTLRDLITPLDNLDTQKQSAEKREAHLVQLLDEQITSDLEKLYHCGEFSDGLRQALRKGNVILALDGLDEVPERLREKVRLAVSAYQRAYRLHRIILTCRIRSYMGPAEQPGFERYTLAPFTKDQVKDFALAWYLAQHRLGKLDESDAREKANDLSQTAWQEDLQKLSENPMLLTTMAIVHQKETRLPNERVKLYSLAVQVLLERWQKHRFGDRMAVRESLSNLLKDTRRVRKILERLAYEAHLVGKEGGKKDETDLLRKDALDILDSNIYIGDLALSQEFLDYVDQRAGLLVGRGGEPGKPTTYSFAHRTFQEYLAGCYLTNQRDAARQLLEHVSEPEYWSLAVEFGAEELYYNGRTEGQNDVLDLAYGLLAGKCKTIELCRAALWSGKMAALVGRILLRTTPARMGVQISSKILSRP